MVQHSSLSKYTIDADWGWIEAQIFLSVFEKACMTWVVEFVR